MAGREGLSVIDAAGFEGLGISPAAAAATAPAAAAVSAPAAAAAAAPPAAAVTAPAAPTAGAIALSVLRPDAPGAPVAVLAALTDSVGSLKSTVATALGGSADAQTLRLFFAGRELGGDALSLHAAAPLLSVGATLIAVSPVAGAPPPAPAPAAAAAPAAAPAPSVSPVFSLARWSAYAGGAQPPPLPWQHNMAAKRGWLPAPPPDIADRLKRALSQTMYLLDRRLLGDDGDGAGGAVFDVCGSTGNVRFLGVEAATWSTHASRLFPAGRSGLVSAVVSPPAIVPICARSRRAPVRPPPTAATTRRSPPPPLAGIPRNDWRHGLRRPRVLVP